MAKIDILAPFILSWEGGFVNDPRDAGGATNKGVMIATWQHQGYDKNGDGRIDIKDLKMISEADATRIMKLNFWNRWNADEIEDQSVANLLVDWVWGSGKYGITIPQQMLGVTTDGIVGMITINALNRQNPKDFFIKLRERRERYLRGICVSRPANEAFLNGWLRRLHSMNYGSLTCNGGKIINF